MPRLWSISSLPIVNEVGGDTMGAKILEFLDGTTLVGWVVAAASSHSYDHGPDFDADHTYWYFNDDLTRLSSYTIKIAYDADDWPDRWDYGTSATYEWVIDESTIPWEQKSVGSQSGFTYYEPATAPRLKYLLVKWPTSTTDGEMQFWSSVNGNVLIGSVGTTFAMSEIDPEATSGYRAINDVPAQ